MGTEILTVFIAVPFLFWVWNLWQLSRQKTRVKGACLLGLGFAFMLFMVYPITTEQYFMQGLLFGGLFYMPFYALAWLSVTGGLFVFRRKV